jgi:hypothetical protein
MEDFGEVQETAYSEDGVDLTLIRWFLTLTPLERLQVLQGQMNSFAKLRRLNGQPDRDFADSQPAAG